MLKALVLEIYLSNSALTRLMNYYDYCRPYRLAYGRLKQLVLEG